MENRYDEEHEQEEEEEEQNDLYALLEADQMTQMSASVAAGLQHMPVEMPASPQTSSVILDLDASYAEVYRSVQALDLGAQGEMANAGAAHLDEPIFAPVSDSRMPTASEPREPQPRAFPQLPLSPSHLFACKPFAELVAVVDAELRAAGADAAFDAARGEWRGVLYPVLPRPAAHFAVYPSSCPALGQNRYLLEFVRLSGCAFAFRDAFLQLQLALADAGVATRADGDALAPKEIDALPRPRDGKPFAAPPTTLPPKPSLMASRATSDESALHTAHSDDDIFQPLMAMAAAPFADAHAQGLALLAAEARKDSARLSQACPGVTQLLLEHLRNSRDVEVRRICCAALADVAGADANAALRVVEAGGCAQLARLVAGSPGVSAVAGVASAEVQRQAARCLEALCAYEAPRAAVQAAVLELRAEFDELAERNRDPRLASSIENVRAALTQA